MKKMLGLLMVCVCGCSLSAADMAKAFKVLDSTGTEQSLALYKGKVVVLEFLNLKCPFVKKHYGSNNMQDLQKKYVDQGVIWLSVCSSAKGNQGYLTNDHINKAITQQGLASTAYIADPDGTLGKSYGAKTTPHMFVIDANGFLAYQGAIDSVKSTKAADIAGATNYVSQALDELLSGKPVSLAKTKSYGCSVKYSK